MSITRSEAHATTWMNLENIMLSERRQTHCMIPFVGNVQNRPIHRGRGR